MMDDGIEKSHFVLIKPLMPLFTGERGCARFRKELGDHQAYKACKNIREFIYSTLAIFEKINPEALDARPPLDDPKILVDGEGKEKLAEEFVKLEVN